MPYSSDGVGHGQQAWHQRVVAHQVPVPVHRQRRPGLMAFEQQVHRLTGGSQGRVVQRPFAAISAQSRPPPAARCARAAASRVRSGAAPSRGWARRGRFPMKLRWRVEILACARSSCDGRCWRQWRRCRQNGWQGGRGRDGKDGGVHGRMVIPARVFVCCSACSRTSPQRESIHDTRLHFQPRPATPFEPLRQAAEEMLDCAAAACR